ncbi:10192_t:CDS:2, partial [Racocetra persica]
IEKINTILTDPDNLRNIDLNTLAGAALKEKGVEEKEIEEQEKNDNSSDHDSQKNNDVVDDKIKNFISNLPLPSAKNVAKSKILELFRKHRPDLEKLKEI